MIGSIIGLIIIGLVAGAIARLLIPGKQPIGILLTIVLGIVGSFVGGTLWTLITTGRFAIGSAGWIGSIIGAVIVLLIYIQFTKRSSRV